MYSEIYWLTVNTEFEYTIHGASIAVVRLYFICKRRIHSNKEEKKKKNSVHCMSFHVYNPHITRQCHHCDWNDARSVLFTTITIVSISNNSSNDIDDDDIEKIQFATKIETEKEKNTDQLKLPCVERTITNSIAQAYISIFACFLFALLRFASVVWLCCNEHKISARFTLEDEKVSFYWNWLMKMILLVFFHI